MENISPEELEIIKGMRMEYDPDTGTWKFDGWTIEQVGGHITSKRWSASKGDKFTWESTRKGVLLNIYRLENGQEVPKIFLTPLY